MDFVLNLMAKEAMVNADANERRFFSLFVFCLLAIAQQIMT